MDLTQPVSSVGRSSARRLSSLELLSQAVAEVSSRRHLIRYLVSADLKKKGSDTLLGNIWWVLDPLLQMLVYVILVTVIFQRTQPAYPLFIFAAILPWKWFTSSVGDAIVSVSGQDKLIKQIQFPKLVLPVAAVLSGISQFAFGFIPLAGLLLLAYRDYISPYLLLIPAVAVVQLVFTMALGFVTAAMNVFFRDIGNVSRHVLRLWFYLSPALYGADTVAKLGESHPTIATLMYLNPFYWILTGYRDLIYYGRMPDWLGLAIVLVCSCLLLVVTTLLFKRLEPTYAKVL
jgi:ABC-type polysaccharide/polyol phosphate export permease